MESLLRGKLVRTDGVCGVVYSPVLENFFREVSGDQVNEFGLFIDHIPTDLYDLPDDVYRDLDFDTSPRDALRSARGNVNLHFLRKPGIGDDRGFERPADAIEKWCPEGHKNHETWLEYVQTRGFDETNAPQPPGIIVRSPNKYSNQALQEIVEQGRSLAQAVYNQFVRPVEIEFEVEIETNEQS